MTIEKPMTSLGINYAAACPRHLSMPIYNTEKFDILKCLREHLIREMYKT
jgi:hypothetical protein